MAADASKLIIPGHGCVFQSAPNAALPANPLGAFTPTGTAPAGWSNLGHTSKQNTISFSKEGGDATTLDTFLDDAVRVIRSAVSWSVNVPALQWDQDNLDLAFNGDWDVATNGYIIPGQVAPTAAGLFILLYDNTGKLGFWLPNTEVSLGDAPSVDTEQFMELNLTGSIMGASTTVMPAVDGRLGIMQLFKTGLNAPAPDWSATKTYALGDRVELTGGEILVCTTAGTSGSTAPTAPASVGGTVVDATVTWTRQA